MPWLMAKGKRQPRLLSLPSLAMVAVSGVTGGVALATLDRLLQQQGQQPLLLLAAVPGLAVACLGVGLVVAALTPSTRRSQQHLEPSEQIREIP